MGRYKIVISNQAARALRKIPASDLKRILETIEKLSDAPRPHDCKKLTRQNRYRVRCGRYRVLYIIKDDRFIVLIIQVGHRREIYRRL